MTIWEYKTIKLNISLIEEKLDERLNALGAEGWEPIPAFEANQMWGTTREILAKFKRERRSEPGAP